MKISWVVLLLQWSSSLSRKQEQDACYLLYFCRITNLVLFVWFSVDAVVARYKHEHIVEGLSLREPVSRVSELSLILVVQSSQKIKSNVLVRVKCGSLGRVRFSLFEVLLRSAFLSIYSLQELRVLSLCRCVFLAHLVLCKTKHWHMFPWIFNKLSNQLIEIQFSLAVQAIFIWHIRF